MGVSKCFSPWSTIPSEQGCCGCTDWSRTCHCKSPHIQRALLPPTDFISPYRKLGQGQHNSEVLHSWHLCLVLVTWWNSIGTDGFHHHCGWSCRAWPVLVAVINPHSVFVQIKTLSAGVLPSWSQGCTSIWPCVHSMHSWEKCPGCSKVPTNIFRIKTLLLKMPSNYSNLS